MGVLKGKRSMFSRLKLCFICLLIVGASTTFTCQEAHASSAESTVGITFEGTVVKNNTEEHPSINSSKTHEKTYPKTNDTINRGISFLGIGIILLVLILLVVLKKKGKDKS
ncbi:LPXTG cell wall anchor domain-containing protein [Enterococcus dongliensis]|uniref:LPXTG cell wall anchor domain-containing protein n=1 Tax=Enterococcus dongliensis TaxID=2559925 RepID=A0AAW8TLE5_9ENTE|nr:LPXTG cell wall anchor domain-containing protein [Enterococcus dongliensis]MDT2596754.1 LPXTG cell wall anchor domain-containing protein [Enterococcus dongliensis]MDT2604595.1 LPXTG cell wall anchor domain-containing protein [Enterococcus dongliensis]MDT2635117.1 LPXTG cell wall anchor domain-containing protein [Enterococcus dongliensis]MDT2636556.1 LPXTG cell wall anchor domain-containing protein [Enterococcus dongliensis]MDT2640734.1 LPXTG cell wall anchor domain-containing protein [Enter